MSFFVKVGCIVFPLKILLAKLGISDFDDALLCVVHHDWNPMFSAYFLNDSTYRRKAFTLYISRRYIAYFSIRTMNFYAYKKSIERIGKHLKGVCILFHFVSIVMPRDNQHIVG